MTHWILIITLLGGAAEAEAGPPDVYFRGLGECMSVGLWIEEMYEEYEAEAVCEIQEIDHAAAQP